MPTDEEDMPGWDVALQALADDAFRRKGTALTLKDFHTLAREHTIRLDDIMETLFLLAINDRWIYTDSHGRVQRLDQATLDRLYTKRRLSEQDLAAFDGDWRPA